MLSMGLDIRDDMLYVARRTGERVQVFREATVDAAIKRRRSGAPRGSVRG
jgi:hypothetical protein